MPHADEQSTADSEILPQPVQGQLQQQATSSGRQSLISSQYQLRTAVTETAVAEERSVSEEETAARQSIDQTTTGRIRPSFGPRPQLNSILGLSTIGNQDIFVRRPPTYNITSVPAIKQMGFVINTGLPLHPGVHQLGLPMANAISMADLNDKYSAVESHSQSNMGVAIAHLQSMPVFSGSRAGCVQAMLKLQCDLIKVCGEVMLPAHLPFLTAYIDEERIEHGLNMLSEKYGPRNFQITSIAVLFMGMPHCGNSKMKVAPMPRKTNSVDISGLLRNPYNLLLDAEHATSVSSLIGFKHPLAEFCWYAKYNADAKTDIALYECSENIFVVPVIILDRFTPEILGLLLYAASYPCFDLIKQASAFTMGANVAEQMQATIHGLCVLNGFAYDQMIQCYNQCTQTFRDLAPVLQMGKPSESFTRHDQTIQVWEKDHPEISGNRDYQSQLTNYLAPRAGDFPVPAGRGRGRLVGNHYSGASPATAAVGRGAAPLAGPRFGPTTIQTPEQPHLSSLIERFALIHSRPSATSPRKPRQ
jgi:hypothetical protein